MLVQTEFGKKEAEHTKKELIKICILLRLNQLRFLPNEQVNYTRNEFLALKIICNN